MPSDDRTRILQQLGGQDAGFLYGVFQDELDRRLFLEISSAESRTRTFSTFVYKDQRFWTYAPDALLRPIHIKLHAPRSKPPLDQHAACYKCILCTCEWPCTLCGSTTLGL